MPWYCSVPGCKSNSQLSVFSVPKDRKRRKAWQNVINVKKLKTHHHICEKHFATDDIVRFTEHRDENGYLLARIPLTRRYLSSSAIPCLSLPNDKNSIINEGNAHNNSNIQDFLVCHDYAKKITETDLCKGAVDNNISLGEPCIISDKISENCIDEYSALKCHDYSQKYTSSLNNEKSNYDILCKDPELDTKIINLSISHHISEKTFPKNKPTFQDLCDNIDIIQVPEDWCYHVKKNDYVALFEFAVKKSDNSAYNNVIKRSIIVRNDMKLNFTVLGKLIDPEKLDFIKCINDVEEFNDFLRKFSKMNFCSGISDLDGVNLVKDNIGFTDCLDNIRHRNCLMFSGSRRCKICQKVTKIIRQKRVRISKRTAKNHQKNNESSCAMSTKIK